MTPYEELIHHVKEAGLIGSTAALLGWDQEVMMPPGGVAYRAKQMALLAKLRHAMSTDPRIGELLAVCEADGQLTADPLSPAAVNLRVIRREYDRATRLPAALVEEFARTTSVAKHHWAEARRKNDYALFAPWLDKLIELSRRKAECYGWAKDGEPWDALADGYEPGCTARYVAEVFTPLRTRLVALIQDITGSGRQPSDRFIRTRLPIEQQQRFVRFVVERIGFDFTRGRLDVSTHPFCSGTHCHDTRMTTRFHEDNMLDALGSTMHEAGHGIYNQNLPDDEHIDTPMGRAVSLAIHESQSRMWENQVGRSRAFWQWCHPRLKEFFGDAVSAFSEEEVYAAANRVQPNFIRVESDEATYNLHIMVRFELERAMMKGDLTTADIPAAWNQMYRDYLGIEVPDDQRGCLQDIHWSMGAIGYFPTYTLGNLYAAQFFEQAMADIPGLYDQFAVGQFGALKQWLVEKIHKQGMRYDSEALCQHVTGRPLSADPLMRHLEGKLRPLYGV